MDQHRRLIDLLSEPTLILSGRGELLVANKSAARLLKLPAQPLNGISLLDCISTPTEEFSAYLRTCSRNAQPVLGSIVALTEDGEQPLTVKGAVLEPRTATSDAVILLQMFPKFETNKHFVLLKERIDDLNREVTKRQRTEYALRAQKEWLQVTLASIGDAVLVTDTAGIITFLNPVGEQLTGWKKADALGKTHTEVFTVVDESTGETGTSPVDHVLRKQSIVSLANNSLLVARDGTKTPIADTAAPIHVGSKLEGVILVFHDVTEKRSLQNELTERAEKLEEANRRKNEFLVMLAHELRNPLAPISNAVELLQLHNERPELVDQAKDVLARQVRHLSRITDDLLDVSRIMRGKISLAINKLDYAVLVQNVCQDNKPLFIHSGTRLAVFVPDAPVWVEADPTRLTQVLENLLSNAHKFTAKGGKVQVSLTVKERHAVLTVSDTGSGIPTAIMPYLFEPFAQAEQSLARSSGGLGLGLSIIKGIVDLHKGRVFAESGGSGKGACFTVILPLSAAREYPADPRREPRDGKQRTVLLIEDNPDTALTLKILLDCLGHDVHVAEDGPEGIQMALQIKPHVIICDIGLPGMTGFAVAEKLREDPETASALLIALTGYGDKSFEKRARLAGFDVHLVKPVKVEVIQEAIKTLP